MKVNSIYSWIRFSLVSLLSLFLCFSSISSASAISPTLTEEVRLKGFANNPYVSYNGSAYHNASYVSYTDSLTVSIRDNANNLFSTNMQVGDYVVVNYTTNSMRNSENACVNMKDFLVPTSTSDLVVSSEMTSSHQDTYCYASYQLVIFNNQAMNGGYYVSLKSLGMTAIPSNGIGIEIQSVYIYGAVSNTTNVNVDQSGVINSIKSQTSAIEATTNAVNKSTEAMNNNTQAVNNAANQAHQDSQAQLDESKKQTEAMEQTKDFVTSTEQPDASDIASSDSLPSVGMLPAGPLDSILLLPFNLMNSILSSLGGNCHPISAPLPFVEKSITFPCFGDTIYKGDFEPLVNVVGFTASAFLLYGYFKQLYKKVDRAISLDTTEDDEWGVL